MKKYKLTEEVIEVAGCKLHRIEALKDFGAIKAGEKTFGFEREEKKKWK